LNLHARIRRGLSIKNQYTPKAEGRSSEFSFAIHTREEALASQALDVQERSDTVAIDILEILILLSDDQKLARSLRTRTRKIGGKRPD
jgi:hypothetical protein